MTKLNSNQKSIILGSGKYPWNNVIYTGLIGQSCNSILSLINQIIYNNNPNHYYSYSSIYNDSASKIFVRAQSLALKSTLSFGSPYI